MKRNCMTFFIVLIFLCSMICSVAASTTCFTGEFMRNTGNPIVDARSFSGTSGPATIKLFNGGLQGADRVSTSTVKINGSLIFGPPNLNQNVRYLEAPFILRQGSNILEVQLMGKPGGIILVEIEQPIADYTGTYCFILSEPNSVMATEVTVEQTGNTLKCTLSDLANVELTGSLNGRTLTITDQIPNLGEIQMAVIFSDDGKSLSGTFSIGAEQGTVAGNKNFCADYTYPSGDPICNLPIENSSLVVGGQQYNATTHTGLDFEFATPDPLIVAPCDGVIKGINRHAISEGNIIFDLDVRYNRNWGTFIAFEPYSPDPQIADLQGEEILAKLNQVVRRGDLLGKLVVTSTEYPHIHWQIYRNDADRTPVCPRTYLTPADQSSLDVLYGSLLGPSNSPLLPVCLAP